MAMKRSNLLQSFTCCYIRLCFCNGESPMGSVKRKSTLWCWFHFRNCTSSHWFVNNDVWNRIHHFNIFL